jgi:hypothetical protein
MHPLNFQIRSPVPSSHIHKNVRSTSRFYHFVHLGPKIIALVKRIILCLSARISSGGFSQEQAVKPSTQVGKKKFRILDAEKHLPSPSSALATNSKKSCLVRRSCRSSVDKLSSFLDEQMRKGIQRSELETEFSRFLQSWNPPRKKDFFSPLSLLELHSLSVIAEVDSYLESTKRLKIQDGEIRDLKIYFHRYIESMEESFLRTLDIIESNNSIQIENLFKSLDDSLYSFTGFDAYYSFFSDSSIAEFEKCKYLISRVLILIDNKAILCESSRKIIFLIFSPFLLHHKISEKHASTLWEFLDLFPFMPCSVFKIFFKKFIIDHPNLVKRDQSVFLFALFHHSFFNLDFETSKLLLKIDLSTKDFFSVIYDLLLSSLKTSSLIKKKYSYEFLIYLLNERPDLFYSPILARTSFAILADATTIESIPVHIENIDKDLAQHLIMTLHKRKMISLSLIQKELLKTILIEGSDPWIYFKQEGLFIYTENPLCSSFTIEEIPILLYKISQDLNFQLIKAHLAPNRIDYELVFKAHRLKKEVKKFNSKPFQASFNQFITTYNKIIEHVPILALLRSLSKELRDISKGLVLNPSVKLRKFLGLWENNDFSEIGYEITGAQIISSKGSVKKIIGGIREKICTVAARFFNDPFWQSNNFRHMNIHGTKDITLYMIANSPIEKRSLRAAGKLIEDRIPLLTGELCGSHTSNNKDTLSFSAPSFSWEEPAWENGTIQIFSGPTSYFQSLRYACATVNKYGSTFAFTVSPEETLKLLFSESLSEILESNFTLLRVMQIKATHPNADEVLNPLKLHIEEIRIQKGDPNLYQEIYHELTNLPLLNLSSSEDLRKLQSQVPIVFGVFNHFDPKTQPWNREIALPSGLNLGENRDTPIVFTHEKDIPRVTSLARPVNTKVEDFKVLIVAECLNMTEGSEIENLNIGSLSKESLQQTIGKAVIQFAAPYYATPLPKYPTAPLPSSNFFHIQDKFFLESPNYGDGFTSETYHAALEVSPKMIARQVHGTMHMLRATIFAQIFLNILDRTSTPKMRYLASVSAAFHDSAREDESTDLWDEMSAWNLRHFLIKHNTSFISTQSWIIDYNYIITEDEILMCYEAVAKKDPPKEEGFKTAIQKAVHDADCIEIIRCLEDPLNFRKDELQTASLLTGDSLDQFIGEAAAFIEETEDEEIKVYYEHESNDPYNEFVRHLQKQRDSYPLLNYYFL